MYKDVKLSIIIPVYNCEQYLKECLESVCGQGIEELQVICIDDCSNDASLTILYEMKKKYDYIQIYHNAINRGQAFARNVGLDRAVGKYIMFVDSDDYIGGPVLKLIEYIDQSQADLVLFDTYMFSDEKLSYDFDCNSRVRKYLYEQSTGLDMLIELIKNHEMSGIACGSIYNRDYLNEKKIKFLENGQHEDIPFIFKALLFANKSDYYNNIIYYYRQRINSTLHLPNHKKLLIGLISGYSDMKNNWTEYKIENQSINIGIYEKYINDYFAQIVKLIENRYVCYLADGNEENAIYPRIQEFHFLEKDEIKQYIKNTDLFDLQNADAVAIYGAGFFAKKIYFLLCKNNIHVLCFYVSELNNNPSKLFDVPVKKYSNQVELKYIVIATSEKIKNQIIKSTDFTGKNVITLL